MLLKVCKAVVLTLMTFLFLSFIVFLIYFITIEDSVPDIFALVVMTLLCCRILYVLLKEYAFTKTEYIEVVEKISTYANNKKPYNKHNYSVKCLINGKVRIMSFKSKHDYFNVSQHQEYVVKRVCNKILEIK